MPPINLYSDTQTRPSAGMRAAIARAVVGDEQRGLDPTTRALEERVAALLGHEAASGIVAAGCAGRFDPAGMHYAANGAQFADGISRRCKIRH